MGWKFDIRKVAVTEPLIVLPELPEQFNGYRIVQISDFHLGTWLDANAMNEIVDLVNRQEPDLIAITGDFVTFNALDYASILVSTLSKLKPRDGTIAVLGNHDHYTDADLVRRVMMESNIIELSNRVHRIDRQSTNLYFAGVDDYMTGNDDLNAVIDQIPDQESTVILLAHEPDFADVSAASGRFAMQISGHTHGGQICLPLWGYLYLPRQGRKYPSGRYMVQDMVLYTNRGLGTSWLKFRYNCPPEIAVFQLFNRKEQNH